MMEDSELWDVTCDGTYIPKKVAKEGNTSQFISTSRKDYTEADQKRIKKNYKIKNNIFRGIGPNEYNRVSACESAKEIWESFQNGHKRTSQVKKSKIDILTAQYELFK